MSTGDRFTWCVHCGGHFPFGAAHVCRGYGQFTYAPNEPEWRSGAFVAPPLTEERVRQIIREELNNRTYGTVQAKDEPK